LGIINILDTQTANLIAAGEVVERPSSAVKEMLENSIDAGAKNITLEIKNGGRSLVRVSDDGCGFLREDIPKALLRHATSKISCGDDINGIKTLGFRGEALAAIGSVSRMDIVTKHRSEEMGTRLTSDEDGIVMVDTGCPDGTTVSVRDLFYNTPARQKFLKRDATEGASCIAAAEKVALSHPEISFTVISDGERKFTTPGDGKLYPTIYSVFGREFAKTLVEIDYSHEGVRVYGYVTKPDASRGSRAMQTVFVNGRYVKSKTVQAALEEAFRSYIPRGKFPGCVLFVSLSPELTDVNVHPAKTEIKFASEKDVFRAVYYGVKTKIDSPLEENLLGKTETVETLHENNSPEAREIFVPYEGEKDGKILEKIKDRLEYIPITDNQTEAEKINPVVKIRPVSEVDFFPNDKQTDDKQTNDKQTDGFCSLKTQLLKRFRADIGEEDLISSSSDFLFKDKQPVDENITSQPEEDKNTSSQGLTEEASCQQTIVPEEKEYWRMVGQAYNAYIFVETPENILVIDKHAAHERILYEKLAKNKELHIQELLAGVPVSVGREQAAVLLENADYLAEKGFALEDFGEGSVIVRTVPSTLHNLKGLSSVLEDFAKTLLDGNGLSFEEKCDRALYTVACKAALKAGIKNSPEDDENVVRMLADNPALRYCPHGRPFIKKLPKREIEKYFDR